MAARAAFAANPRSFEAFCEAVLLPLLRPLEARRRKVMALASGAITGFAVSLLIFFLAPSGGQTGFYRFAPLLWVATLASAIVFGFKYHSYRFDFKQQILPEVLRFVSPDLGYDPSGGVKPETFAAGRLFTPSVDRYSAEDHVQGKVGATACEFSEVHAEHKEESNSDEKSKDRWTTIFKGLYFVADFNKEFRTHTVVLPDRMERFLGFVGKALQKINPNRDELIALEDPEFEREFVVYGEDQVEARYILTPALMQRMLALKKHLGAPVYFAFSGSSVHVAIESRKDHFEPGLFSSLLDLRRLTAYHTDLALMIGIVDDLNLNTRIWTKS